MVKKPVIIVLAAIWTMSISVPVYAGAFDGGARLTSSGKSQSTSASNNTDTNYPGRIEGTWQQRGNDWYYELPDGSDLKNGYVDGYYMSWVGRMIPGMKLSAMPLKIV